MTTTVLHLVNSLADSSITRIVERILRGAGCAGYRWWVGSLSGDGAMADVLKDAGAEILDFSGKSAQRQIREHLQANPTQIVHTHTPRTIVAAWRATSGLPDTLRSRHLATKHLLTGWQDRRWGAIYALVDLLSLYLPDHLAPVSVTMAEQICATTLLSTRRVTPVPNGIPCEAFCKPETRQQTRAALGLPEDALVFGYAGRLEPVKRVDLLLSAFQKVHAQQPRTRLLILGEGQLKTAWQKDAESMGIAGEVIWAGFRRDIAQMLAAMDVYVQPSANEGLSLSILEAMSAGKAVIATRVGAAHEIIQHNQTGLLISPNSEQELTAAMRKLIDQPQLMQLFSQSAFDRVREVHSIESMVAGYQRVYQLLIRGAKNG